MRKILLLGSLLVVFMFLVSCAPQGKSGLAGKAIEERAPYGYGGDIGTVCGDGITYAVGEECDDGNTVSGDGCSSTCKYEGMGVSPDLSIESVKYELVQNASGKFFYYNFTVRNTGSVGIPGLAAEIAAYLKSEDVSTYQNVYSYIGWTPALLPGESTSLARVYIGPDIGGGSKTTCPGTHTLQVIGDYFNVLGESDEANNFKQVTVYC